MANKIVIYRNFKAFPASGETPKEPVMDRPLGKPRTCYEHEWEKIKNLAEMPNEARVKLAVVNDGDQEANVKAILAQKENVSYEIALELESSEKARKEEARIKKEKAEKVNKSINEDKELKGATSQKQEK